MRPDTRPGPGPFGRGAWKLGKPEKLGANVNLPDMYVAGPWLSPDNRTLYFSRAPSTKSDSWDIYRAVRAKRGEPFEETEPLPLDRPDRGESHLSMSRDGLHAVLTAGWQGTSDLWVGRRSSVLVDWDSSHFSRAVTISTQEREWDGLISWDGLRVYFMRAVGDPVVGSADLFRASRDRLSDRFGPPDKIVELATVDHREDSPALSPDESVIVFSSNDPGGKGGDDLWWAKQNGAGFGAPTPVPNVNTANAEREAFISFDGRELFFASNRDGKTWQLYRVEIIEGP